MTPYWAAALLVLTTGLAVVAGLTVVALTERIPRSGVVPIGVFAAVGAGLFAVIAAVTCVHFYVYNFYPQWWVDGFMKPVDISAGVIVALCAIGGLAATAKERYF